MKQKTSLITSQTMSDPTPVTSSSNFIIFIPQSSWNCSNLLSILFGDILAISNLDLLVLAILLAVYLSWLGATLPKQILLTLNADLAQIQGIPVQRYKYIFMIILSLAIALTIRAVGILLVNAFLVIPAATAKLMFCCCKK